LLRWIEGPLVRLIKNENGKNEKKGKSSVVSFMPWPASPSGDTRRPAGAPPLPHSRRQSVRRRLVRRRSGASTADLGSGGLGAAGRGRRRELRPGRAWGDRGHGMRGELGAGAGEVWPRERGRRQGTPWRRRRLAEAVPGGGWRRRSRAKASSSLAEDPGQRRAPP
jgi:hypothetical protein